MAQRCSPQGRDEPPVVALVESTGYRTESEIYGKSAVFHLTVRADPQDILGAVADVPWWLNVRGADWANQTGRISAWLEAPDHLVTDVSHNDALACCAWAGRRLPTEAEWEFAARGGLEQARSPWGNELRPLDARGVPQHRCDIWQGVFPAENTLDDGYLTTAPVRTFQPNGFGLYQTSGNVWEWCSDWFVPSTTCPAPPSESWGIRRDRPSGADGSCGAAPTSQLTEVRPGKPDKPDKSNEGKVASPP